MESIAQAGYLGGDSEPTPEIEGDHSVTAEAWPSTRSESKRDGGSQDKPAAAAGPVHPLLEQLKQSLHREALRFRQNTAGSMTVIVSLAGGTELMVHFSQRDGGVDAIARCELRAMAALTPVWGSLQQALVARRVRLAPLRTIAMATPANSRTLVHKGRNNLPLQRPGWETWA